MTRPLSLFELLRAGPVLGRPWRRRALFGLLIAGLALLSVFPPVYRAAMTMSPSDPATLGLQGALGELGAFNTVFGNQAQVEIALRVARSTAVRDRVMKETGLLAALGLPDRIAGSRWLDREVSIRSLRGGILQVELKHRDPEFARRVVSAFADATREELAEVAVRQTAYKRAVLEKLVADATDRMLRAQAAYDDFRLRRRAPEPNYELASITARIEAIRGTLKSRQVQLMAARQFATDDNIQVRQLRAEMAALNQELRRLEALSKASTDTLGSAVDASTRLVELERELTIARSLYISYSRFLEGTAVEDLTATANVRILETPYIDTARQFRPLPLGAAVLLFLLWLAAEAQPLRRPVGVARPASAG